METNQSLPAAPAPANEASFDAASSVTLDLQALAAALTGIRADSRRDPENYLLDTVVPSGGE